MHGIPPFLNHAKYLKLRRHLSEACPLGWKDFAHVVRVLEVDGTPLAELQRVVVELFQRPRMSLVNRVCEATDAGFAVAVPQCPRPACPRFPPEARAQTMRPKAGAAFLRRS